MIHIDSNKPCILVTGGAGYIGAHCSKELWKKGFLPIVYDNLSVGHKYAVKWGPLIIGDLSDREKLNNVFSSYNIMGVMHFAAFALVEESVKNPQKYYHNNVANTLYLLDVMHKHKVKNLIFSSSCATYGNPKKIPIDEEHSQNPINPYGHSKLMTEQIIKDYSYAYGINFALLRYFNAAGADIQGDIGENHKVETHLIPLAIQTALGKRNCLHIFGTDFDTKDKTAIRDYIHVTDLADAHVKALTWLIDNNKSLTLNLGTGVGLSVLEVFKTIEKVTDKKLPIQLSERRIGDPPILVADNKKAKKTLNWSLKYSDPTTIISSAWKWHNYMNEANL